MLVMLFAILPLACSVEGRVLHLRHEGADMPIWIRGNTDSDVMIVFVAGGPGVPVSIFSTWPSFRALEEHVAIAYVEQRGAGNSLGNADERTMTLDQLTEDLSRAVTLVQHEYSGRRTFLLANSWAGAFALPYLSTTEATQRLAGWISLAALWDVPRARVLSRLWAIEQVEAKLAAGDRVAYWTAARAYYEATPTLAPDNWGPHYRYVGELGGNDSPDIDLLKLLIDTPLDVGLYAANARASQKHFGPVFGTVQHRDLVRHIVLPTLLVYGEKDGRYPPLLGQELFDAIGAPDKALHLFERSGHNPQIDEPDRFARVVRDFVH